MSTLTLKLNAAKTTSAWQLALDKYPLHLANGTVALPEKKIDVLKSLSAVQPNRAQEWKAAIAKNMRFLDTLEKQHGPRFRRLTLVNSSRLLLHLGRASVLENVGLYCDRTTGLPVIPGSAVKGVVSTWACWEGNQTRETFSADRSTLGSDITQILGTNPNHENPGDHIAGNVTFVGGFPSTLPTLELDIVTPHPEDGKGRITPNPFLAVAPGCIWHFPLIASARLNPSECTSALEKAKTWLEGMLTEFGMGAKTAAGFGGFRILTDSEKSAEQSRSDASTKERTDEANDKANKERKATLSPEDQAYEAFIDSVADWTAAARDILKTDEPNRGYILRYFRSDAGKAAIASWPKNDKAKQRKADLKEAGL